MVRLLSDKKMKVAGLLLRAGVPSAPMSESAALALINEPKEKLARLWHAGGILRLIDADAAEAQRLTVRAAGSRAVDEVASAILAAEAAYEALPPEDRGLVEARVEEAHRARWAARDDAEDEGTEPESDEPPPSDPVDPPPGDPADPTPPVVAPEAGLPGPEGESADTLVSLDGLTIPQAAPVIEAATDIELLQEWRERDSRKGVHELIDERLEALTAPPGPPEG